jgi:hypothetical protein
LAGLPRERDPEGVQAKVAGDGDGRAGRPLELVVSGADEQARFSAGVPRNGQHGE